MGGERWVGMTEEIMSEFVNFNSFQTNSTKRALAGDHIHTVMLNSCFTSLLVKLLTIL